MMSHSITPSTVNHDGFTENDIAARQAASEGKPFPYDNLVTNIRKAYRDNMLSFRCSYSVGTQSDRNTRRREIEQCLVETFSTSQVRVEYDVYNRLTVNIVVIFPD